jgi:16S rRNA (cytidine1402-2'-O)-methyltransferase
VFYEAPHRIEEAVADLANCSSRARLVIARELTKLFEPLLAELPVKQAAKLAAEITGAEERAVCLGAGAQEGRLKGKAV